MSQFVVTSARYQRRKLLDKAMTVVAYLCTLAAIVPLVLVLVYVAVKGLGAWSPQFFTGLPQLFGTGGGIYNAIIGTAIIVGLASLMGIPFGVMAGIYLAEYGNNRLGSLIRFTADVMTGIPSIVVGIFAYGLLVVNMGGFNAFAGAFSLAILMVPIITRTTEEMIRLVPGSIREAALALGAPRWKTIMYVVVPTALGGIMTGILLSIARIAGETAPLILTILGSNFLNTKVFQGPIAALPLQIYDFSRSPYAGVIEAAWGASLVLVLMVLVLSLAARLIFTRR
ncbi:MAG: phosphate ABC transporter permease PstA [Actinomycetota bacterium]|nr:phosphate ABC transporter permease PstA [Actinomycetota bacterium]MDQ3921548.1 phosphate ABC transporter permease PstA [Actinomycetota bacterium]